MGIVTAIWNRAGGVGKTTLTREIGYELCHNGLHVLLIDADSQGNLGDSFGLNPHDLQKETLFWEAVCSVSEKPELYTVQVHGMAIALSNLQLAKQEKSLENQQNHFRLWTLLEPLKKSFDHILIDCAPSEGQITIQVLSACDRILIPVQPEDKGVSGLLRTQENIIEANRRRSPFLPPISVVGVVPSRYENLNLHRYQLEQIQAITQRLEYPLLSKLRKYVALAEAYNQNVPLRLYDAGCPALSDLESITKSFLK